MLADETVSVVFSKNDITLPVKQSNMKRIITLICFTLTGFAAIAQLNPAHVSIPMRDGKFLAADVYLPNNDSVPRPTILIQTPYNKSFYPLLGLPLQIGMNINSSPFNFVIADWRCFYASASACMPAPKRGQDGYDCVEWISQQSWSDGKIGTWGASALGLIQFQTAKENPPHLVCSVPIVAGMSFDYSRYYPGGVYRTEYVEMLDMLGYGLSATLLAHPVHDIYWTVSESTTFYPDSINIPMFMIGGWYDHATEEVLQSFEGIRTQSPMSVRSQHKLLMGPWTHNKSADGQTVVGELSYPQATAESDSLARIFFNYYLLNDQNGWNNRPVVQYFQMGENTWKNDSSVNSNGITNTDLYFHQNGLLDLNPPSSVSDSTVINYDPHDPSPTVGGPTLLNTLNQGPYDQAPLVESRNDLLSFTTNALPADVIMRGMPVAHLKVSSDKTDTDFSLRITDVYPDGRSMLVIDGIRRMRFRNGYQSGDTSQIIAGNIYSLDINLFEHTAITFLAGHKIRVDITSSNYPRFDCNLNNGGQMYAAGDTLTATNTVYVNTANASYITLPLESFPNSVSDIQDLRFDIFPNPSSGYFIIRSAQMGASYSVLGTDGREIKSGKINSFEEKIDVRNLSSGNYFLRVEKSGKSFVKRVTVE
jgi:predicted acyl esterase